jgi:hypothetical protein
MNVAGANEKAKIDETLHWVKCGKKCRMKTPGSETYG